MFTENLKIITGKDQSAPLSVLIICKSYSPFFNSHSPYDGNINWRDKCFPLLLGPRLPYKLQISSGFKWSNDLGSIWKRSQHFSGFMLVYYSQNKAGLVNSENCGWSILAWVGTPTTTPTFWLPGLSKLCHFKAVIQENWHFTCLLPARFLLNNFTLLTLPGLLCTEKTCKDLKLVRTVQISPGYISK